MMADPAGLAAVNPSNLQTWNRYAYVMNNPVSFTDPTGLDCVYVNDDSSVGVMSGDCASPTDDGYYVDGTVDPSSFTYNSDTQNLGFSYTTDDGVFGVGTIAGVDWSGSDNGLPHGGGPDVANNQSYGWTFTKALFKNFSLKAVYNSLVDENGCDRQLFGTFAGDLVPVPTDDAPGPVDAVEPTAKFLSAVTYNQALGYAATTGLTCPLKSSVFRGFLGLSEGIETSVPAVTVAVATVHSLGTTIASAITGECH